MTLVLGVSVWAAAEINISVNTTEKQEIGALERTVERYHYNFGLVRVNSTQYVQYTVTNSGTTPLTFDRALIGGMGFDAYHSCDAVLAPNAKCKFEISYNPPFEGMNSGRFILSFKEDLDLVFDVTGTGSRY